jgi:serine/threonine protein kinase
MRSLSENDTTGSVRCYLKEPLPGFEFMDAHPKSKNARMDGLPEASAPEAEDGDAAAVRASELLSRALAEQPGLFEVGEGRYGAVRRLRVEVGSGFQDFVGKFYHRKGSHEGSATLFDDVIARFRQVHHPCVARILRTEASTHNSGPITWTDFVPGGSLGSHLAKWRTDQIPEPWSATQQVFVICCIVLGLKSLHDAELFHGSLNPSELLLGADFQAHITDYLSYTLDHYHFTSSSSACNPLYTAPECAQFEDANFDIWDTNCIEKFQKVDMFSLGLIFFEILTRNEVFPSETSATDIRRKIQEGDRPSIPGGISRQFAQLIDRCWDSDPLKRPSIGDVWDLIQQNGYQIVPSADPHALADRVSQWLARAGLLPSGPSRG